MSKKFSLEQLTEGIRQRHVGTHNRRLVEKWARTGLLRGLEGVTRENMATLLENQAAQVLREANSLSTGGNSGVASGDIRGFTNIAFPIVRRVFGGLVANELVSIQPMSLPSGLLFYLDYTYGTPKGAGTSGIAGATYNTGSSVYNSPAGKGVRSGSLGVGGQYDLAGSGYSRVGTSIALDEADTPFVFYGAHGAGGTAIAADTTAASTGSDGKLLQFDPQICSAIEDGLSHTLSGAAIYSFVGLRASLLSGSDLTQIKDVGLFADTLGATGPINLKPVGDDVQGAAIQDGLGLYNVRRLNQLGTWNGSTFVADPLVDGSGANDVVLMVVSGNVDFASTVAAVGGAATVSYLSAPTLSTGTGDTLVIPTFESDFGATPSPEIPEIDIKIESIAVTAVTRKLRARWSPELAQDLNAYHSLDAEVELTQILSEQVALELDREILNDLLTQAKTNYYWSRAPGNFINKKSGTSAGVPSGASFTGTVREWYETLTETIIDVANEIHRLTLRGSANFIVVPRCCYNPRGFSSLPS